MVNRPPSPEGPSITLSYSDDEDARTLLTTAQLRTQLEPYMDPCPNEDALDDLLMELDRRGYVEWVTVTKSGTYVWDVTDSPDLIADAVAKAVVDRLMAWLGGE